MKKKKAHAGIEFLIMFFFVLSAFAFVVSLHSLYTEEASKIVTSVKSNEMCLAISGAFNALYPLGEGSSYLLNLSTYPRAQNHSVWISIEQQRIVVDKVSCPLSFPMLSSITNSSFFQIERNLFLRNSGGVMVIEQ
ncbi:MAG: hypothetical protein QXW70_00800 [Candidatus Anstonellales archaeon]